MQPVERIASRILVVRGRRVMVDADLAALYGVETKRLNQQVRRNRRRFPADFVFELTDAERAEVVAKCDHLARLRFSPAASLAYTEHGALMASAVLNTSRAVEVSLYVVRAFVQLRESIGAHREIGRRLDELERKVGAQDGVIVGIVRALRELTQPPPQKRALA
ncbi:MAG: ORF6N domain-containing protein [Betaproteobacteria bacterium]|nr:ORF6N domain-containing protein [Betaproteobacteria bacterium]MDH5351767.1 ORF6N domain-containing protein [Betaproteobacteria bacterium]